MRLSYLHYDLFSFIISLCTLIFISNKIEIQYNLFSKPIHNVILLLLGTFLASFLGTTVSTILFLKPILKVNSNRKYIIHTVIFFIFLVLNMGGSLTPLGDPPLFLGYMEGIPYGWTFQLLPEMLLSIFIFTSTYFLIDFLICKYVETNDSIIEPNFSKKFSINGKMNFIWLLLILLLNIFFKEKFFPLLNKFPNLIFIREAILILLVIFSELSSGKNQSTLNSKREKNYYITVIVLINLILFFQLVFSSFLF